LSLHVVFMLIPMLHNFKREQHAEILRNITKIAEAGHLKRWIQVINATIPLLLIAFTNTSLGV
jgi:hypothetical protein